MAGCNKVLPITSKPCHKLSHALKQTSVRCQRTKAQPSKRSTQHSNEHTSEHSNVVDPDVTLYHRPRQHSISINLRQPKSSVEDVDKAASTASKLTDMKADVSYHNSNNDTLIAAEKLKDALRAIHRQQTALAAQDDKEEAKVHSIEELMCHEIKPGVDMSQLPAIYARLSKVRLTGMLTYNVLECVALRSKINVVIFV
jgi:hypothetical protein